MITDHADRELPDLPDDLFRGEAERRVKVGLVVNELINAHGSEIRSDAKFENGSRISPRRTCSRSRSSIGTIVIEAQLSQIEMAVLEDQVVEHILENAYVSEIHSSYEDIIGGRAMPQPEPATPAEPSGA